MKEQWQEPEYIKYGDIEELTNEVKARGGNDNGMKIVDGGGGCTGPSCPTS